MFKEKLRELLFFIFFFLANHAINDMHFYWVLGKEEMHITGPQLMKPPIIFFYLGGKQPILHEDQFRKGK